MTLIKKSACVLLCLLFAAVLFPVKASAITIDGLINTNSEWKNATETMIFPYGTDTNSYINYTYLKVLVDKNKQAVYLGLHASQHMKNALESGNTSVGVRLNIKPGTSITCSIGTQNEFDTTSYSVDKGIVIGTNNDVVIEIKIGYLLGLPENPLVGLQLIDSSGKCSNEYRFPVVTTTTQATTKPLTTKPVTTAVTLYKIKFDSNGGTGGKTQSLPYGTVPAPPIVNRKGYSFSKWSPAVKAVSGATTYTAQWVKTSTSSPTTQQTRHDRASTATNYNQANRPSASSDSPGYITTSLPSVDENTENEASILGDSTKSQNNSDKQNSSSVSGVISNHDTNEASGTDIKKQIAAVVVAIILLSLAGYFLVIASKQKKQPTPEPEKPPEEMQDSDLDDDF